MAKPDVLAQIGWLYFIESEEQDAVKIGFATDVYVRLKGLQTGNPDRLELTGQVPCTYEAELAIHRALKEHAIRLEWYPRTAFILSFQNEVLDVSLDRAMDWLADNPSSAPVALSEAGAEIDHAAMNTPITAADIAAIIDAAAEMAEP